MFSTPAAPHFQTQYSSLNLVTQSFPLYGNNLFTVQQSGKSVSKLTPWGGVKSGFQQGKRAQVSPSATMVQGTRVNADNQGRTGSSAPFCRFSIAMCATDPM